MPLGFAPFGLGGRGLVLASRLGWSDPGRAYFAVLTRAAGCRARASARRTGPASRSERFGAELRACRSAFRLVPACRPALPSRLRFGFGRLAALRAAACLGGVGRLRVGARFGLWRRLIRPRAAAERLLLLLRVAGLRGCPGFPPGAAEFPSARPPAVARASYPPASVRPGSFPPVESPPFGCCG